MQIVEAKWTANGNILIITCDCGKQFGHKACWWTVICPQCSAVANVGDLRNEYVARKTE